jgi:hypothetical protein
MKSALRNVATTLTAVLALSAIPTLASAAEPPPPKALWQRNMGQSGLRRFYATDADLGEMNSRISTYQVANRLLSSRRAANPGAVITPDSLASSAEGYVGQYDSLWTLPTSLKQPLFLHTLARTAERIEEDKLHSRNNRYDLGLLYAPNQNSYIGASVAVESTSVDLKYVRGATELDAIGPRVDVGYRFSPVFAVGFRAEELHFDGDNVVTSGALNIRRDIDYRRRYIQAEGIVRLSAQQWSALPTWLQVGGSVAVNALNTRYESQRNSLGQVVQEPFGNREHMADLRTGLFLSATFGKRSQWNPYTEVLVDHEIDSNLTVPLNDRTGTIIRIGTAYLPGTGKRVSLEYQHSQSRHDLRKRDGLLLLAVFDF